MKPPDRTSRSQPVRTASPEAVLGSADLTREQKVETLQQMAYDARELDVAGEEGMAGPPSNLTAILRALASLGARDEPSAAKQ